MIFLSSYILGDIPADPANLELFNTEPAFAEPNGGPCLDWTALLFKEMDGARMFEAFGSSILTLPTVGRFVNVCVSSSAVVVTDVCTWSIWPPVPSADLKPIFCALIYSSPVRMSPLLAE